MIWYGRVWYGMVWMDGSWLVMFRSWERYQKCLDPTERTIPISTQMNARIDIAKQRLKKKSNYG
jgi:hypothetical protein